MVRDADAFIGIYPLPGSLSSQPTHAALCEASRYFRLELDLAIRSRKPSIVFHDNRYRSVLHVPAGMYQCGYDTQEIAGKGGAPTTGRQLEAIESFSRVVAAAMRYGDNPGATQPSNHDTVGLLLPSGSDSKSGYNFGIVSDLTKLIEELGYRCTTVPSTVNADFYEVLGRVDWVVVDVGCTELAPIIAFLHGQFTPMLFLKHGVVGLPSIQSHVELSLFGAFEVGYSEDVLEWTSRDMLMEGVANRLTVIQREVDRLNTVGEARAYFKSAALRKERVFVSYAGADESRLTGLHEGLRQRFQEIFDYKDAGAISPGADWLRALFTSLSQSAVGIICLSKDYLDSGPCEHEALELITQRDQGKTLVFVVNLDGVTPPEYMRSVQYVRPQSDAGYNEFVAAIVSQLSSEEDRSAAIKE